MFFWNARLLTLKIAFGDPTQKPRLVGLASTYEARRVEKNASRRKGRNNMLSCFVDGFGLLDED